MTQFDVLQPSLNLHQRYFVEASAGCGKTFSIENIVVRLIMDVEHPLDIEKILVLTFTKEATSELKARIRKSIEYAKNELENPKDNTFEFLRVFKDQSEEKKNKALWNLQEALGKFDSAQIFTIHKFCFMKLKQFLFDAKLNLSEEIEQAGLSLKTYERVVRDYLGFNYNLDVLSLSQLKLLLGYYKNDLDLLLKSCVYQLVKEIPIEGCRKAKDIFESCHKEINKLKKEYKINSEEIFNIFQDAAFLYKGACNRGNEISKPLQNSIYYFSKLFSRECTDQDIDSFIESYSIFKSIFKAENLKKSSLKLKENYMKYFSLYEIFNKTLFPHLESATRKEDLLANLCFECQKLFNEYLEKNKILTPNNILNKFNELINDDLIAKNIQSQYQAVIVDEFQDTDPVQWQILSKIFLKENPREIPFYLVGDPKQSIYGFRRADIYTYLKAAQMLGVSQISELNVNYRSQPGLLLALNDLFAYQKSNWLSLPQLNESLIYRPVLSSEGNKKQDFNDDKKSVHFIFSEQKEKTQLVPSKELEETILFPFIVNEILRLHHQENKSFSSFAILVRDRYQGARIKNFLKKYNLPFMSTRPESMQGLPIVALFLQIYLAVLHPKKSKYIFALKLNPLLNLSDDMFEDGNRASLFSYFSYLHNLLFEKGFLDFYQALMNENKIVKNPLHQQILSEKEGLYLYLELEQIKDLLLQVENEGYDPYHLLKSLEDLSEATALAEKTYPLRQNFEEVGIQLLTLHMSKGLEFEIVFALGLINQIKNKDSLILDTKNNILRSPSSLSEKEIFEYYAEQNAEKMRQLYVAMTRAKQRLYIPCIFSLGNKDQQSNSPLDAFLESQQLDFQSLMDWAKQHPEMSYSYCMDPIEVVSYPKINSIKLIEHSNLSLEFFKEYKHSFTSLSSFNHNPLIELKAPHDFLNVEKTIHTLPAGSDTGALFHKILEFISFDQESISIEDFILNTPYEPWLEVIRKTIDRLLITPIKTKDSFFTLNMLKANQVFKEIEFLYPISGNEKIEEVQVLGGFLQGFIDLVCVYNEKYYVIDYKTNWLGSDEKAYLNLEPAMFHHQYFLQAKIYREALKKYLKVFNEQPFEECFGGTIYWFIRGLEADNAGIFFIAP